MSNGYCFRGLINHSVIVYLDDITVYSKYRPDHINHLRNVFERCRKFGISLNPKKQYLLFQKVFY